MQDHVVLCGDWKGLISTARFSNKVTRLVLDVGLFDSRRRVVFKVMRFTSFCTSLMALATKLNFLDVLNGSKQNSTIKLKIILPWKSCFNKNLNNVASIDMILIDEKGQ